MQKIRHALEQQLWLRAAVLAVVGLVAVGVLLPENARAFLVLKSAWALGWCLPALISGGVVGWLAWSGRACLITTALLLIPTFLLFLASGRLMLAFNCSDIRAQLRTEEARLAAANRDYQSVAGSAWLTRVHAVRVLLENTRKEVGLLARGEQENCFGDEQALRARLDELNRAFAKVSVEHKFLRDHQPRDQWVDLDDVTPVVAPNALPK